MKSKILLAAVAMSLVAPATVSAPAFGREKTYYGHRTYRARCRVSHHTTGTIAGGVGGAVVGNAIGGGALGTIAGGVGGALLGRHIDKKEHQKRQRERGCA